MEKNLRPALKSNSKTDTDENRRVHFAVPGSQAHGIKRSKPSDNRQFSYSSDKKKRCDVSENAIALTNALKCDDILNSVEPSIEELGLESCTKTAEIATAIDEMTNFALSIVDLDLQLKPIVENDAIEMERTIERMEFPSLLEMNTDMSHISAIQDSINQAKQNAEDLIVKLESGGASGEDYEKLEKVLNDHFNFVKNLLKELHFRVPN